MIIKQDNVTKINGLTGSMEVIVFNHAKEESETMTVRDLLLNHMSGHVDYSVLGWNIDKKTQDWYEVDTVFLEDHLMPTFALNQTQTNVHIEIGRNSQTRILLSSGAFKKFNKIKPTDELQVCSEYSQEPVVMMPNWVQLDHSLPNDVFEISIKNGKSIIINGIAVFASPTL